MSKTVAAPSSEPPHAESEAAQERAARFLAAHLQDVLASVGDGIVLLDGEGSVILMSPGAEDLTGMSAAQTVGRNAAEAFAANPWIAETVARSRCAEVRRSSETGELATPYGRRVGAQLTAAPVLDADGKTAGTLLLFSDTGGARSLAQKAERDARADELSAVAAGLAHEIKNPLGGIKGAAQLLGETLAGDPEASRFTTLITREVDRVSALLEQLLELTRPPRLRLAAVNVHRILHDVLLLEHAAGDALTVRCEFDPSLPDVWADEAKLRQVFLNLVRNALQATGRKGTLTITTRLETGFHLRDPGHGSSRLLSVEIADSGPGIAPEDSERIFAPFFTTKASGTGLGLAVSQRLVAQHGGLIRVESEPGRGARFCVSLPVARNGGDR